jgi:hypothetical protein
VLALGLRNGRPASAAGASAEKRSQTKPFELSLNYSAGYIEIRQNEAIDISFFILYSLRRKNGRFLQNMNGFDVRPMNLKIGESEGIQNQMLYPAALSLVYSQKR